MPDEDKHFGGALVLDFRKRWRHVQTIYMFEHFCFFSLLGFLHVLYLDQNTILCLQMYRETNSLL